MPTELVRVTTDDGCQLDGVLQHPDSATESPLPFDACLLVHGTGGNFYAHGVLETFALRAVAAGAAALRINTRGHDQVCSIPCAGKSRRGGATYENVAECRLDLAAWIALLSQRGYSRILLAGHSMGGVKSTYTLAYDPFPVVRYLAVISSPRFDHARFQADPQAARFREDFARARELVAAGQPEQLLRVTQPMPLLITAGGFVEKYGPADPYNLVRWLPRVQCPTVVVIGTRSPLDSIAFAGLPEQISELAAEHRHISLRLVEGADTNYSGQYADPFEAVVDWACSVSDYDTK